MKDLRSSIRITEESFHLLYDEIPIGIGYCSSSGNILYCNPRYLTTVGLDDFSDLKGYNIFDGYNFSKEEVEYIFANEEYCFRSKYEMPHDRFPMTKAPTLSLSVKISRVSGEDGSIRGFLVYLVDHTEVVNENTRRELKVTRRYKGVIDRLPVLYFYCRLVFDENNRISDFIGVSGNEISDNLYRDRGLIWGVSKGSEFFSDSIPIILGNLNNLRDQGLATGDFRFELESVNEVKDILVVFEDNDHVNIICNDVTALVVAERMKTHFVHNMSHEIRTPLNAIVGFSQLLGLEDGILSKEEKDQYVGYINNNSNLLTMLIDDILDLSDAQSGSYKIEKVEALCNEMCRSASSTVEYRVPPGVRFYFTSDLPDDYTIYTDPRRVQQVLINFLTNACKHTTHGEIHLHCSRDESSGKTLFTVTDTGSGVPVDKADSIFERFVKINPYVQGTGLGLNICKTIASHLGGEVGLDKSYTLGARFYFAI